MARHRGIPTARYGRNDRVDRRLEARTRSRRFGWEATGAWWFIVDVGVSALIGGIRLQTLTAMDLHRLYGELLTTGRADGTGPSPRTVRYAHVLITSALGGAES